MASNIKKRKFHIPVILRPAEYTEIYNLAHYEKRWDIPGVSHKAAKTALNTRNLSSK